MLHSENLKKVVFLFFCLFSFSGVFAQIRVVEVSHYLFPEFEKGVVLMKTGVREEAMLNYNSITEEMIFINNGIKLAMSQLELIDTVFIAGRKFIPFDGKFLEQLFRSRLGLFVQHKCSIKEPGKPAGYGGTSQTSATTTYSSYLSNGQLYDMKLPEGTETKPYVEYWLRQNGTMTRFLNLRQLQKLFADKSILFKDYLKKHEVKYNDEKSIVGLVKYMNSI